MSFLFKIQITLTLLIAIFVFVQNAKILAMFPMCTHSHYLTGFAIAKELAIRGHEVTFVSCYAVKKPIKNFRDVYIEGMRKSIHSIQSKFSGLNKYPVFTTTNAAHNIGLIMVEKTLTHPQFQAILHSNETFDLVINEDCVTQGLFGVAAHFGAKSMLVSSWKTSIFSNFYFGNPEESSYVPFIYSQMTTPMSFLERCKNVFYVVTEYIVRELILLPSEDKLMHKYLPNVPNLRELVYNQSLMLVNSHVSYDWAVPMLPNIIEIGGYHIEEPKTLPKSLQKIIDEAKDGIILFSLGSNIKSSDLKPETIQIIMKVFAKMKETILWKCDNESIVYKPANVYTANWFPQNDILAHPKVKVFITQGGMMSTIEAVYHGVPMLGLPFFADQHSNIYRAIQRGYTLGFSSLDFTENELARALEELITNPKYRKNVEERSKLIRDRPMKPMDTAVYWVEYVIRNGGTHFKSGALDLRWYQRIMLDVFVFFFVISVSVIYLFVALVKKLKTIRTSRPEKHKAQ